VVAAAAGLVTTGLAAVAAGGALVTGLELGVGVGLDAEQEFTSKISANSAINETNNFFTVLLLLKNFF